MRLFALLFFTSVAAAAEPPPAVPAKVREDVLAWLQGQRDRQLRLAESKVKAAKKVLSTTGYSKQTTADFKAAEDELKKAKANPQAALGGVYFIKDDGKPYEVGPFIGAADILEDTPEGVVLDVRTVAITGSRMPEAFESETRNGVVISKIVYAGPVKANARKMDLSGVLYVVRPATRKLPAVIVPVELKPEDFPK